VIGGLVQEKASVHRDKVFLYFKDEAITNQQLENRSNRFANGFRDLGITKNIKVASMMKNHPDFLFTWFGLSKLGGVEMPINNAYKGELLKHIINNSESKILVIDGDMMDRLILIKDELPKLERIICHGDIDEDVSNSLAVPILSLEQFFEYTSDPPECEVEPKDPEGWSTLPFLGMWNL
jgi:crotonobetaine/carnitine-CoA ligase